MPTTYTKIPKATGTAYTGIYPQGKQVYDEADITYDDASVFYDSDNMSLYTNVPKPAGGVTIAVGMATGLVMPPTYATSHVVGDKWTKIPKAT